MERKFEFKKGRDTYDIKGDIEDGVQEMLMDFEDNMNELETNIEIKVEIIKK